MHTISQLINDKALFVINHSGGKDSQVMMIKMLEIIPASQMLVVHASLGDVEWKGALELAEKQARDAGVEFIVARAEKSFLDMVEKRFADRPGVPSWPSAKYRQCTSDLKRNPIERDIRRYMKARGLTLVVSCTGIRAAESNSRSKLAPFKLSEKNSKAGRSWYEWCPIFKLSTAEVFATIKAAGQQPHEAYALGNERLSCVFCIMGSKGDLALGAKHNPELFARYVELEERTGYTMHMSQRSLTDLVNDAQQFAA
jgi:3'-phosphoadenosine 5'-phosphosulfate sulfotransferase (PAPS reductase)/FAD synthetase